MDGPRKTRREGARRRQAVRPFPMPPKRMKSARRRMMDFAIIALMAFCALTLAWGYGISYQMGYAAAEEARHA